MSDDGLNYQCAEALCDIFQPQLYQATCIVMELDAVPVYQDTIGLRKGDLRDFWEWGLTGWDLPVNSWTRFSGELQRIFGVGVGAPLVPSELLDARLTDKVLGPGFKGRTDRMRPEAKDAFFEALGYSFDERTVADNLMALQRLINHLDQHKKKVFFLRMPFHAEYWQHPTSQRRERYAEMAIEHVRANCRSGVPEIIDLRHMPDLQDSHFSDWTHLSASGAAIVSKEVDRQLNSRLSRDSSSRSPK